MHFVWQRFISGDVLVTEPALLSACNETKWPAGNALFPIVAITSTYYLQLQGPHALLGGAECGVFRLCPHSSKLSGCGCGWLMDWRRRGLSVQPLLLYWRPDSKYEDRRNLLPY
jgi:hypothetical protein